MKISKQQRETPLYFIASMDGPSLKNKQWVFPNLTEKTLTAGEKSSDSSFG